MALAYTVVGLQAELDALETARKARDWDGAWDEYADYVSVWATLPESTKDGDRFKFPDPAALKRSLEAAFAATQRSTRDRILHTRTNYATR